MASLSDLLVNTRAIVSGEWVRPGELWGDLEVLTRGKTAAYRDALRRRNLAAARALPAAERGRTDLIPEEVALQISADLLLQYCFLDVRNLNHPDGRPVTADEVRDLVRTPEGAILLGALNVAADMVGEQRDAAREDAAKN